MEEAMEARGRLVGDYILGPKIGAGSFASVWRARHRKYGHEVAVKEIDKQRVDSKVRDCLLKEVSILRNISHPNIVRFFQAIQTEDKIFLVLEYCAGGDVADYLNRQGIRGRVSEDVARHFLRQLAEGLKVLRENNLIHRDLKPQNLLLSTSDETAVLKIGDFGFARYLMPQGLADTFCGSPLYMAPEIIQDRKYDAKADLWSVGTILFQLVTGKLPFDGDTHRQLFMNIMASHELHFPEDVSLHPDCTHICKRLLRRNPVERLSFEEFFNHNFLNTPRTIETPSESANVLDVGVDDAGPSHLSDISNSKIASTDKSFTCLNSTRVADSLEFIEQDYVLVNANFALMETCTSSLEPSLNENSTSMVPNCRLNMTRRGYVGPVKSEERPELSIHRADTMDSHVPSLSSQSQASFTASEELHGTTSVHPFSRIQFLSQYINALTELTQEKLDARLSLESFSLELVILAIWKVIIQLCDTMMASTTEADLLNQQHHQRDGISQNILEELGFTNPVQVFSWAENGFLIAYDRAEKLSNIVQHSDGEAEMPDAMEIIFQMALTVGKNGAVEELMGQLSKAAASYSKAITYLTFVMVEATQLPLNPPFSLSSSDRQRLCRYVSNLRTRLNKSQMADSVSRPNH
ncbi:serine/threonine-protein kinase ATG1a isoform X2 [Zingiber officinale]|uniref:serine/threonine-protein kinase ATG1a isoform X1 n=1 Tax=Zingiber officinale TaxID=94328 RepID=UPI001C4BE40B|nr:serine/threonine-protein kinase ATG1a isoform X1 [Zingiber officinale]XP_042425663.1 serine/threonine-protein kinase ATG1a isoform X2 [Zingiber officinale]